MKKNASRIVILTLFCLAVWVVYFPRVVFAVGEYNGAWCGVETANVPDYGPLTATFWTVIYQEYENELFVADSEAGTLRLIKSGSRWILPSPFFTTYMGHSVRVTSFTITFQGESRLTGTFAFEMEGINVTATFFANKSSCQIVKNGPTLSGLSGGEDSVRCYGIEIPAGATHLDIKTWGGSGDCDLDVIHYRPDFDDHASCNLGNQEEITLAVPHSGRWYVFLFGYSSYSGLNLNVSYVIQVPPRPAAMPWLPLLLNDE